MPAMHITRTTSTRTLSTIPEVIGATTRPAVGDLRHVQPNQPQPHHHYFQHLHARDPGASNPQLGGAIVASVTGSILIVVFLCVYCRRRPRRSSETPAIVVKRLGPNEEVERSEEIFAFTRRKAPKAEAAGWHSPPASMVYMEEAHISPPVHR